MHLHAEWADEAREQVLPVPARSKRQHLSYYSLDEQLHLVRWGQRRLIEAGSPAPTAFRAGSYRFNEDTLRALGQCGFEADTSYNHCSGGLDSRIGTYYPPACVPLNALEIHGVAEFPVTVFRDRPGHLRPMQLTACSLAEMRAVLDRAADEKRPFLNIVSHNFELLDRRDFSLDKVVFRRFLGLCDYLRKHVDRFETVSFASLLPIMPHCAHPLPTTGSWRGLGQRLFEQALRRA